MLFVVLLAFLSIAATQTSFDDHGRIEFEYIAEYGSSSMNETLVSVVTDTNSQIYCFFVVAPICSQFNIADGALCSAIGAVVCCFTKQ